LGMKISKATESDSTPAEALKVLVAKEEGA
jgi:hypothetical protein